MKAEALPNMTAITPGQLAESTKVEHLKPVESDFAGKRGYRRRYRADGSYTWRYRFKPNDAGKKTHQQQEVEEMLKPFQRADTERHARLASQTARVALKDEAGSVQYVEPYRADQTARRNGWHHQWMKMRGGPVMRTFGGKLYRCVEGEWVPA